MQFRQGDIYFVQVDGDYQGEKVKRQNNRIVIAEGEITGHAHAIHDKNATMYRDSVQDLEWLVVDAPVKVVHEEHATINLPAGIWQVIHQRQYVRGDIRRVLD